jgi:hypothetical protein
MKNLDRICAIFCFFLGLVVLVVGLHLRLQMNLEVGPGFLPFVVGGILAFLSIILLVQSIMKEGISAPKESFWVNPYGWKLVLLTLFVIVSYPLILNHVGFPLSSFLLIFSLFVVTAHLKWWVAGVWGAFTAVVVYLIFEVWLKANMPRGVLGF